MASAKMGPDSEVIDLTMMDSSAEGDSSFNSQHPLEKPENQNQKEESPPEDGDLTTNLDADIDFDLELILKGTSGSSSRFTAASSTSARQKSSNGLDQRDLSQLPSTSTQQGYFPSKPPFPGSSSARPGHMKQASRPLVPSTIDSPSSLDSTNSKPTSKHPSPKKSVFKAPVARAMPQKEAQPASSEQTLPHPSHGDSASITKDMEFPSNRPDAPSQPPPNSLDGQTPPPQPPMSPLPRAKGVVQSPKVHTPRARISLESQQAHEAETPGAPWTQKKLEEIMWKYFAEVDYDTATLTTLLLETVQINAPQRRHVSSQDMFAVMKPTALVGQKPADGSYQSIRFKQHLADLKPKKGGTKIMYPAVNIFSEKDAVPRYRFHHVEISKNVLAPNSMLNFVPHLIDVDPDSKEEQQYFKWLNELNNLDTQSGFEKSSRVQKAWEAKRDEQVVRFVPYLDDWIQRLALPGCTKSSLIRLTVSQAKQDKFTPRVKARVLEAFHVEALEDDDDVGSSLALEGARLFAEAFNNLCTNFWWYSPLVCDVLLLDKMIQPIVYINKAKDTPSSKKLRDAEWLSKLETALGSYAVLGCWICFSHDCQHGEFDAENQRHTFSVDSTGGLGELLKRKWTSQDAHSKNQMELEDRMLHEPCKNNCYRSYDTGNPMMPSKPWTDGEVAALESVFYTLGRNRQGHYPAQCEVAALLGRRCWEVYRKIKDSRLALPELPEVSTQPPKMKSVPWYDRKKKALLGDWHDATVTHEHAMRRIIEPCHHDGPCTAAHGCPCASENPPVLCERFCQCTEETCALKFTGCACHSLGKTCSAMKKDGRPCICVQLNRECDPVLCVGCGAGERADPENAHDEQLHAVGCQNVVLQRGASKAVLVGRSQLEGCGYGLFTAEDISADEFIIEYTGELITHDEGVRREARRGDVFDEKKSSSYLFTLLENEGIWVDAAMYGNLSRYINHDKVGANITPKIQYVNGEYRIKFTALHHIRAGEELFFNYGDNFPNLTKKLLEDGEEPATDAPRKNKAGRPRKNPVADTTKKQGGAAQGKARKTAPNPERSDDEMVDASLYVPPDDEDDVWHPSGKKKKAKPGPLGEVKKRGGARAGAGRKKKVRIGEFKDPAKALAARLEQNVKGGLANGLALKALATTPIGSTASLETGLDESPSSRRRRLANAIPNLDGQLDNASSRPVELEPQPELPKPKSNRGGARPGAGRKPKKHKQRLGGSASTERPGTSLTSTSSTNTGTAANGQDGTPSKEATAPGGNVAMEEPAASSAAPESQLEAPKLAKKLFNKTARPTDEDAPTETRPFGISLKRKADEIEDSDVDEAPVTGHGDFLGTRFQLAEHGDFAPRTSGSRPGSRGSRESRSTGGTEDTDDVLVRSARKRVKPAKYRDEDEET